MTPAQKLTLELTESRKALSEHIAIAEAERAEDWSDKLSTLTRAVANKDIELTAARLLEPEPSERRDDAEGRELRSMMERANIGNIFTAVVEHRATEGVEAELQQHYRIGPNAIPLALLETRAVTPAPTDTGASQQPILQPVFHEGDAAFLGVDMPTVPVGDSVYPVLTNRPTVGGPHKDSTSVAETTGAFTAEVLEPSRLQASFFYRRTDAARFAGMSEALRQALSSGLSEALDKQVVDQVVSDVGRTAAAAADDFASYRKRYVYDQVDGRFATVEGDIRLLVGAATLAAMSGLYRSNNADDSAVDSLRRISGGLRVSPHVAAVASSKQDVLVRKGMRRDAVAPLWQGVSLIADEVTKAATGEIVITAVLLAAFKVIRTDGFARIQAQHS